MYKTNTSFLNMERIIQGLLIMAITDIQKEPDSKKKDKDLDNLSKIIQYYFQKLS